MSSPGPAKQHVAAEPAKTIKRPIDGSLLSIMRFAETMANTLEQFYDALESASVEDFEAMGQDIASMRGEVARLQADELAANTLPAVTEALAGIREVMAASAESILHNAENALQADRREPESYAADVNAHLMRIIEACGFQDLAGQRLERIDNLLRDACDRLERFASAVGADETVVPLSPEAAAREKRRTTLLLHGPQNGNAAVRQEEIDSIFDRND